ncbi:MAG TPA: hypothetical protein VIW29_17655 [Polyangiaceae bacterium]
MSELARRKYLERYAEPEARFAQQLGHQYSATLVVPLCGEDESFLDGLAPACAAGAASGARVLLIVIVNGTEDAAPEVTAANQRLLGLLAERLHPRQELAAVEGSPAAALLGRPGSFDLLLIDRASAGRCLPPGEGVGLARRIGGDLALGLHERGGVLSPWLCCSDADARLPLDYFPALEAVLPRAPDGTRRAAMSLPFWHVPSGNEAVDSATFAYELSLRYYTLGLAFARSPYAYESLGSSLCAHADAYAEVRGFPRLKAGEDFYLLDKLAKVGSVHRPALRPLELLSRVSERVPFGTGARVGEMLRGQELRAHHPRLFELLRLTLQALRHAVRIKSHEAALEALTKTLDAGSVGAVSSALDELRAFEALRDMLGASPDARVRERRLLTWFDALRTLRFLHLLEVPAGLPRQPLSQALAAAPFCGFWRPEMSLSEARMAAFSAEQALPSDIGVESAILGGVNDS